jgi:phosphoribosylamine--glycine ligase
MRFLGVTETCDLGSLYLRLIAEGHEVRVAVSEPLAKGTMRGLVPLVEDWRASLNWVRDAGHDGVVLFEAVSEGFGAQQDELRSDGYHVLGGSAFGDRLENDRAYAQEVLGRLGFPTGHVWKFASSKEAISWIAHNPRRLVAKFSGADHEAVSNYVGELADGSDVAAYLSQCQALAEIEVPLILMEFIDGVEVGIGAYFDGDRFLEPA